MTIQVKDRRFRPYMSAEEISEIVNNVAKRISDDLRDKNPLFLGILNGSFVFAADLMRALDFDAEISFVKFTSYNGTSSTGKIKQLIGFNESLQGRTVVVVEDIIDTGISMEHMLEQLRAAQVADVKICTFFFKPGKFQKNYKIDYIGKSIPDDFILGYGLDYDGLGRTLKDIYVVDED